MAFANFKDIYLVVGDTGPTTQVYSSASNTYVANNVAAYDTWLNAGNFGFFSDVSAKANNGVGLVRLTLDASQLQTGQRWLISNVSADANGIQIITKIDATHVDLQGTTFNAGSTFPSGTLPKLQGAAIVATDVLARAAINGYNITTAIPNSGVLTGSINYTLTNPLATRISISNTTAGNVFLPVMNAPNSIPIGTQIEIRNDGQFAFTLKDNGGTNVVNIVSPNTAVDIVLVSNATANGTFLITTKTINIFSSFIGQSKGLKAFNNVASPNTKLDITAISWQSGIGSRPAFISNPAQLSVSVLDTGLAGPAVNGRDQSGAFAASQWLHVFGIGKNSEVGDGTMRCIITTDFTGPVLPTGYQYYAYLFSVYWTAGSILSQVTVRGSTVYYPNALNVAQILSAGAAVGATPTTAVSSALFVPPAASNVLLEVSGVLAGAANGINFGTVSGLTHYQLFVSVTYTSFLILPNVGQNFYYNNIAATTTANMFVMGYTVPNGDS